jgi:hypothetical protein
MHKAFNWIGGTMQYFDNGNGPLSAINWSAGRRTLDGLPTGNQEDPAEKRGTPEILDEWSGQLHARVSEFYRRASEGQTRLASDY